MSYDDAKIKAANEELETRLLNDRSDWRSKINELVFKMKNMNELSDCQIHMLSYRQILLDKISDFKNLIYKKNSNWDKYYKSKYREYTLEYDVKLTSGEKHQFIKADLSALKCQIDMLQSHIDYYQECIRTLDNLAFAIRNRIRLEDDQL